MTQLTGATRLVVRAAIAKHQVPSAEPALFMPGLLPSRFLLCLYCLCHVATLAWYLMVRGGSIVVPCAHANNLPQKTSIHRITPVLYCRKLVQELCMCVYQAGLLAQTLLGVVPISTPPSSANSTDKCNNTQQDIFQLAVR